jgi:hypothetical protein
MKLVTTGTLFPRSVGKLHLFRSSGPIIGITADGLYEWTKISKLPNFFTVNAGAPFAIAGIWDGPTPSAFSGWKPM